MYIPKINLATDQEEIIAFMKRFSFATIITSNENIPIATHLPFLVSIKDDQIVLTSHFAKANDHWKDIETFPHHRHEKNNVFPSKEFTLEDVMAYICKSIIERTK